MGGQLVHSETLLDIHYTLHHQLVSNYQLDTQLQCCPGTGYQLGREYTLLNQKCLYNHLHIPKELTH